MCAMQITVQSTRSRRKKGCVIPTWECLLPMTFRHARDINERTSYYRLDEGRVNPTRVYLVPRPFLSHSLCRFLRVGC